MEASASASAPVVARLTRNDRIKDIKAFIRKTANLRPRAPDGLLFHGLDHIKTTTEKSGVKIIVEQGDTLTVAQAKGATCILNMASGTTRGGGLFRGASAQEESICARTDLFSSMECHERTRFPEKGGIYSPAVRILRDENFKALTAPFYEMAVISCAAIKNPDTTAENKLNDKDVELTIEKMKFILRCADKFGHRIIVLGAFGCGAYRNPPHHIAELWERAIFGSKNEQRNHRREEWTNIQEIIFAIKDRSYEGNYGVFKNQFEPKTVL
jgi:uncharacterized protein (TIGR02452 family)